MLEVHGANLEYQTETFKAGISELSTPLQKKGIVQWIGPYEASQLATLMRNVDWVVVPSVWWENSPMVIQEALALGRPVIVSDIGGMAEKVVDGVNGRHVPVGNVNAWGRMLTELARDAQGWDRLHAGIVKPITYGQCAEAHLELMPKASQ